MLVPVLVPEVDPEPGTVISDEVSEMRCKDAEAIPEEHIPELVTVEEIGPPGCTVIVLEGLRTEDIGPPGLTLGDDVTVAEDIGPPGLTLVDVTVAEDMRPPGLVEDIIEIEAEDIGPPG